MTTPTPRLTITAPNPMPSDIDWARVESELGVRIVQGAPWLEVVDSSTLREGEDRLLRPETDPVDRVRQVADLLRLCGFPEISSLLRSDSDVLASFIEGFATGQHVGSPGSSVAGASEGSDAAGSTSPDSAASCHCGDLLVDELVIVADRDGGMAHTAAECFGITEVSYKRKWSQS